jgi:methionyl-tRNA synthetase
MEPISIDEFKKVEIKVGEIKEVSRIEGSEKLLKLKVNFGPEDRQVLSGIGPYFEDVNTLIGKRCLFVTNLAPRMMMGLESQAMIMATGGDSEPFTLFETTAQPGSQVR